MAGAICDYCKQDMLKSDGCKLIMCEHVKTHQRKVPLLHDDNRPCHDCACRPGYYHHPGCDVERCPFCGKQAIMCGCMG